MQYVVLPDEVWPAIDSSSLAAAAGATSYGRGVQYLRQGAVTRMRWDRELSELHGSVLGSADACYETVAYFQPAGESVLEFEQGHCSCPVGFDCKHVVALVLAAAQAQLARTGPRGPARSGPPSRKPNPRRGNSPWSRGWTRGQPRAAAVHRRQCSASS